MLAENIVFLLHKVLICLGQILDALFVANLNRGVGARALNDRETYVIETSGKLDTLHSSAL
jgi:hypothetical protein